MPEDEINNNPKKYFDKLKSKNKKNSYFSFRPFEKIHTNSYEDHSIILNASSGVNYYYNKNSEFKSPKIINITYSSQMNYKTRNMEKTKTYTNGNYKLTIETKKNSKGVTKYLKLIKKVNENSYTSTNNPYFAISNQCNWANPTIMNLAETIKANVTKNANKDKYNMELANAAIRYVQTHIKYDYTYSSDQSAITTLKRGSGTCTGNTMLAGALLRALGIPTYFESSSDKTSCHMWQVSYIFYENSYQWIPAEPTYDFTKISYYPNLIEYKNPFTKNALDWWIIDKGGKYDFTKRYDY
jgi:transglutaminase-like putative cysteine protease